MPNASDIQWFKAQFAGPIRQAVHGTPFSVDLLTAIACQETGYIWASLRKQGLGVNDILRLCVGDTIDAKSGGGGRKAFPKNRAQLLTHAKGQQMFKVARDLLVEMAHYITSYTNAAANPAKFCRGFGMFQYDLQFFDEDQSYFMGGGYARFEVTLAKCIGELRNAARKVGVATQASLTDAEAAAVAIAYNSGGYNPARKLKQGYFDGQYYYGENIANFLKAAHAVPDPAPVPEPSTVPPPVRLDYVVKVASTLNLRRQPDKDADNVFKSLPNKMHVTVLDPKPTNGFLKLEATIGGETVQGYGWSAFLVPAH